MSDAMEPEVKAMLGALLSSIKSVSAPYPGVPSYLILWERVPETKLLDVIEAGHPAFWQTFGCWGSRITALNGVRASLLNVMSDRVPVTQEAVQ